MEPGIDKESQRTDLEQHPVAHEVSIVEGGELERGLKSRHIQFLALGIVSYPQR